MAGLSAHQIAEYYSLVDIDAKIATYQAVLDGAASGSYSLDTTQGRQSVTTSDPNKLASLLAVWLKARAIKTGTYTGAQIIPANYTP
jgi:hypothetical protein